MNRSTVLLLAGMMIPGSNAYAGGEPAQVVIRDFAFTPQEVTVRRGESVRWENQEKRQYHSVWFETSGEPEPEYFFPEESYQRDFPESGSFPYRCGPHPEMTGVVHVLE